MQSGIVWQREYWGVGMRSCPCAATQARTEKSIPVFPSNSSTGAIKTQIPLHFHNPHNPWAQSSDDQQFSNVIIQDFPRLFQGMQEKWFCWRSCSCWPRSQLGLRDSDTPPRHPVSVTHLGTAFGVARDREGTGRGGGGSGTGWPRNRGWTKSKR